MSPMLISLPFTVRLRTVAVNAPPCAYLWCMIEKDGLACSALGVRFEVPDVCPFAIAVLDAVGVAQRVCRYWCCGVHGVLFLSVWSCAVSGAGMGLSECPPW